MNLVFSCRMCHAQVTARGLVGGVGDSAKTLTDKHDNRSHDTHLMLSPFGTSMLNRMRILTIPTSKMQCKTEDKESTGCSPFPTMTGPPVSRRESLGSEDSWNEAQTPSTFTGRLLWPSLQRAAWLASRESSEDPAMPNSPVPEQQPNTSGRMTPELMVPNLNLETEPSTETIQPTGTPSGDVQYVGISWPSQETYVFDIIEHCGPSQQTTLNQLLWSELVTYSSVQLEQVNQNLLGNRQVYKLTVKIPTQNSGAVTVVKKTLSSMNFVAESMSRTYYDGLIVIRSTWKSKEQVPLYLHEPFGLRPMWILNNGIPTLTHQL